MFTRLSIARSLLWLTLVCVVAMLAAACSGSSSPGAGSTQRSTLGVKTPPEAAKPAAVPQEARQIRADLQVGERSVTPGSAQTATTFYSLRCQNGLLSIATTEAVFYAELPCDRSLPDDVVRRFLAQPVTIRVKIGDPTKLYVDSAAAGSVEFTVGAVWIVRSTN